LSIPISSVRLGGQELRIIVESEGMRGPGTPKCCIVAPPESRIFAESAPPRDSLARRPIARKSFAPALGAAPVLPSAGRISVNSLSSTDSWLRRVAWPLATLARAPRTGPTRHVYIAYPGHAAESLAFRSAGGARGNHGRESYGEQVMRELAWVERGVTSVPTGIDPGPLRGPGDRPRGRRASALPADRLHGRHRRHVCELEKGTATWWKRWRACPGLCW